MPIRSAGRFVSLLLLGGALLQGCGLTWATAAGPGGDRLPTGRVLVLARVETEENRSTAETAAEMLAGALRRSGEVISSREFFSEAHARGFGAWAPPLVDRLQRGGWPTQEERGALLDRFLIRTLIAVDVPAYEQVWGKYAKFTRVGVDAQAFHFPSEKVIWQLHAAAEVEEMRGRAFQYAMEEAVHNLSQAIHPRSTFSLINAWRYWRR